MARKKPPTPAARRPKDRPCRTRPASGRRRTQSELEQARDRLSELYDFAPNGYLTLDGHGVILQVNLTGAAMLGRQPQQIEGMPLLGFAVGDARDRVLDFLRRCRRSKPGAQVLAEVQLRSADAQRTIQLVCRPRARPPAGRAEYFAAMIDMTEHRILEAARQHVAAERAALAGRLISIQEDERRRIARDLHDNVGQQITVLRLKLDSIAMAATANEAVRAQIADAQAAADQLDRALDFIAAELRPASLDLGLVTALQQFVHEWSATFGIRVELHADGLAGVALAPEIETHLYRVAQEALNNVYKHAAARHVNVILERRDDRVVLIVEDNGRGFEWDLPPGRGGLGLLGMRERAELVGGAVEIESAPDKGTTVFFQVPLPPRPRRGRRGKGGGGTSAAQRAGDPPQRAGLKRPPGAA